MKYPRNVRRAHASFRINRRKFVLSSLAILLGVSLVGSVILRSSLVRVALADTSAQTLPFAQNWTNTGLITANDDWSGVPGITGFRGDNLTAANDVDPQTVTAADDPGVVDVNANQTAPNTFATGGVTEFHITDPTIALTGSGTADAPYIKIYLNTTGLSSINVAYNLRDIDGSVDNAVQQVALQFRVGSSGTFTNVPAGYVADATTGPSLATLVTPVSATLPASADNQPQVEVRIITTNATGNDEWVGIDDISVTGTGGGDTAPSVSSTIPADNATGVAVSSNLSITFSEAVNVGATWFQIVCGTSGTRNVSDTVVNTGDNITFSINPNTDFTAGENCIVTVDDAQVTDQDATDPPDNMAADFVFDFTTASALPTPIHDIQGNGTASPLAGQVHTTTGIVTLLRTSSNGGGGAASGFFLQEPDATTDADPNTSEGIFVFTSSVPTYTAGGAVAVGDELTVTGTVVEFNGLTEIGTVTNITIIDTGNTLPTAVTLDSVILDPAAPGQPQLEKYESMRMTGASLISVAPNDNFFDVDVVLSSVARPMREPGIPSGDAIPPDPTSGLPDPNIAIWDRNPERLNLDTNGRAGAPNTPYTSNVTFTSVSGPLDFAFGEYRLIPDAAPTASSNMTAVPVPTPVATEFTIASYNIENFNNNATQRQKASLTIRTVLHYPDIIGAIEIFDLADLQALRDQINNDAVANSDPNPLYEAYLIEQDGTSEDSDQDVGFLVKTSRVSVTSVTQEREEETFAEPGGGDPAAILHDRPPLLLDAVVDPSGANPRRVLVIVNHLRSFIDAELVAGDGPRVREKRKKQAESLADLLNDLQTANSGVPVISVGDYNAYQFSSGLDDSLSVIKGNPTADDQIVVDQSPDLVDPNFTNITENVAAAERYSFIFEGTPQALDHHVINTAALSRNTRIAIARVNSDFPDSPAATYEGNAAIPERNSDHDPVVSYYSLGAQQAAGSVIISEFRFRGPGTGGSSPTTGGIKGVDSTQDQDEFIEIYNNTDSDITVSTTDGSNGWTVVASTGSELCRIDNGTLLPARGHFLCTNVGGYSLNSYASGDVGWIGTNIPDGGGVALFRTNNPLNYTLAERLDAAGYTGVPDLYREGTGFPTGGNEMTQDLQYSFYRTMTRATGGLPKDTGNNTADFMGVSTNGTSTGQGTNLGAPGPENLSSPINRNSQFTTALLDPGVAGSASPNRVRNLTPVTNGTFGTMTIRRTFTNNTGDAVTRLRFRIVEITTLPSLSGVADLRALDSSDEVGVPTTGGPVNVFATIVEQPPTQASGGGWNTSLNVPAVSPPALPGAPGGKVKFESPTTGTIQLNAPLNNGQAISVNFRLGVMQTGAFVFFVNIEAGTGCPIIVQGPCVILKPRK